MPRVLRPPSALLSSGADDRDRELGAYEQMQDDSTTESGVRRILLNATQVDKFCDNFISTGKYSVLTFVPKFLWEQFRKYNNIFFALIAILQQIPGVSPTGRWTTLVPLVTILMISALKEIIEDVRRHRADQLVNRSSATVFSSGKPSEIWWQHIRVGDLVKVCAGEQVPADLLLLWSSEPQCLCYIETANLDGETNLKLRKAVDNVGSVKEVADLLALRGSLDCELPNKFLYEFKGTLNLAGRGHWPLGASNILQRGSTVKNTEWAFGIAVYTGRESKVMLNSVATPLKRSHTERVTNIQIIFLFAVLLFLSVLTITANVLWSQRKEYPSWYAADLSAGGIVMQFLTFIILYNNIVPISLQVTLEMVKFMQAMFISWDVNMYYQDTDTPAVARTSNLNEELGQIKFVFSDKTGTLTRNVMEFRGFSAAGHQFRHECLGPMASANAGEKVNLFRDVKQYLNGEQDSAQVIDSTLTLLAVCHTVVPGKDASGKLTLHASSPDEAAIVSGIQELGYVFSDRTPDTVTITVDGQTKVYTLLTVIEFTSTRKRMSVIVRGPNGEIKLMCKGADSVIMERLSKEAGKNPKVVVAKTLRHLEAFASAGLRTLCLAEADLTEAEYGAWASQYNDACCSMTSREARVAAVAECIEQNLILLGATAIEDQLQEGVPETIASLAAANMKIWVLTGDKQETAINIGYSCNLLGKDMPLLVFNSTNLDDTRTELQKAETQLGKCLARDSNNLGLVIEGATLKWALSPELANLFLDIALSCNAVICCRVSPLQKAEVVCHVKKKCNAITLAIGDGANDVSMIQAADVGIGISGHEGMQAVCASDYAIAQFRFLRRLLLVHGAWSYARVSKLILYSFYKNVCLYIIELWFATSSAYSGQIVFDRWCISLYNVLFTAATPLALGVFDRLAEPKLLEKYPQLYRTSQDGTLFNARVFWMWMVNAAIHSVLLYYLTSLMLTQEISRKDGQVGDYLYLGNYVYTYTVIAVCFKAGLESQSWTAMHHLALWGSLATWFVFFGIYASIWHSISPGMYGEAEQTLMTPLFWLGIVIIPFVTLLRDIVWKIVRRTFMKTLKDRAEAYHRAYEMLQLVRPSSDNEASDLPPQSPAELPVSRDRTEAIQLIQRFFAPTANLPFQPEAMSHLLQPNRGYAFSQEEEGAVSQTTIVRSGRQAASSATTNSDIFYEARE